MSIINIQSIILTFSSFLVFVLLVHSFPIASHSPVLLFQARNSKKSEEDKEARRRLVEDRNAEKADRDAAEAAKLKVWFDFEWCIGDLRSSWCCDMISAIH